MRLRPQPCVLQCITTTNTLTTASDHFENGKKKELVVWPENLLMDGLSAGASGIAVVSIAIQLAESIKTFSDFIGSIQEAPEDIQSILSELHDLSLTLNNIHLHHSMSNINSSAQTVLKNLQRKITAFMTLANKYKPGLDSKSRRRRKWNAIKVVFKHEKFKKLRESLNETKITLSLALLSSQ